MKYNLNEFIKSYYEIFGKSKWLASGSKVILSGKMSPNEALHKSSICTTYLCTIDMAKLEIVMYKCEFDNRYNNAIFAFLANKKAIFQSILNLGNTVDIGFAYLIGYGTKKDLVKAKEYLGQTKDGKRLLAQAYIVGKGVSQDFNKAFEVYPELENPVCDFKIYMNDEVITVRKLIFGEDKDN